MRRISYAALWVFLVGGLYYSGADLIANEGCCSGSEAVNGYCCAAPAGTGPCSSGETCYIKSTSCEENGSDGCLAPYDN